MKIQTLWAGAAALALCASPLLAQDDAGDPAAAQTRDPNSPLNFKADAKEFDKDAERAGKTAEAKTPQEFVEKAAIGGMFEIKSSEAVLNRLQSAEVREFAEKMIDDHMAASEKLAQIAEAEGLTVPAELDAKHQEKLGKLSGEGANLDADYVEIQLKSHEKAVALFDAYRRNGDNQALKDFASATLPTLEEHLADIRSISDGLQSSEQFLGITNPEAEEHDGDSDGVRDGQAQKNDENAPEADPSPNR